MDFPEALKRLNLSHEDTDDGQLRAVVDSSARQLAWRVGFGELEIVSFGGPEGTSIEGQEDSLRMYRFKEEDILGYDITEARAPHAGKINLDETEAHLEGDEVVDYLAGR
tara:strand:- start:1442 stop:1771 length:330 start_codon:yes stop_codon:yes gene_type:complete